MQDKKGPDEPCVLGRLPVGGGVALGRVEEEVMEWRTASIQARQGRRAFRLQVDLRTQTGSLTTGHSEF